MKRLFDIVVAALGLVLLAPIFVLVAIAIKLTSRGPVFFRQERMGRGMKPFRIYKFRTMVADAPSRGAEITAGSDRRITAVGRVLRASKVDELPQLINVLTGEMSLVGPRPEVPKYVAQFPDDFREILVVRPGITDPASLKYRHESQILGAAADPEAEYVGRLLPEKLALAKLYIARQSFWYDLSLIVRTLLRVVR